MGSSHELEKAQRELLRRRKDAGVTYRPPAAVPVPAAPQPIENAPETAVQLPQDVKAYPTLQNAFKAAGLDQAGRLYLLLLALDTEGRGIVSYDDLRAADTRTWRHTRRVLAQGHGVAWVNDRENRQIVRFSPARIASKLDGRRLRGLPVAFPVSALLDGMQAYRAYCLAAWHAGRDNDAPITRETVKNITGAGASSQRTYEQITDTKTLQNIAIDDSGPYEETKHGRMYEQWGGVFRFYDYDGKLTGKRGAYAAWRMPNSYRAELATLPKGRQRKHNKRINLVTKRARGNDADVVRIYHLDGNEAGQAYNRHPDHDHYFRAGDSLQPKASKPSKLRGAAVWQFMERVR